MTFCISANVGSRIGNYAVLKITGADSTDMGKYSQLEVDSLQKVGQEPRLAEEQYVIRMLDHFSLDHIFLNSSLGAHSCLVLEVLGMFPAKQVRYTYVQANHQRGLTRLGLSSPGMWHSPYR